MSADVTFDFTGLFAEQADAWDRLIRQRDSARAWAVALEQELSEAQTRITLACGLVDGILDHAPEECDCDDDGSVCAWHKFDDALRGVR